MHKLKAQTRKWIQWGVVFLLTLPGVAQADEKQTLTVALSRAPITLDARYATDAASIRLLRLLSEGLVRLDEDFNYAPALAGKYTQDNFQTYSFVLRDNLTFSDGTKLTAQHVVDFYRSIMAEGSGSPLVGGLGDVNAITTLNDNQISFHLNKPNPWFLTTLETPIFKLNGDKRIENPVGVSDMRFMKKDDIGNVWLEDGQRQLKLEVIQDPTVRVLKLMRGEVDVVYNDLSDELYTYTVEKGYKNVRVPSASYTYIGFNLESGVTSNLKVRQALAYAINRPYIIEHLLDGEGVLAHSLLLDNHPAVYQAKINKYDVQKAVQLLKEAGYNVSKDGSEFELSMSVTTNPFVLRIAQIIQQQLKDVGIHLNISSSEWGSFYGNIKKGNFESYILTWVGRFQPDIFYNLFHSSMKPPHGANRGRYDNPEMDRLLEIVMPTHAGFHGDKNRAEGTPFSMDEIYRATIQVQQLQEQEKIYIPLWRRHHGVVMGKNIEGCQIPADGGYEGLLYCARN